MFIQEANSNLWKVQLPSRSNHDPCTPLSSSFSSLYSLIMFFLLLKLPSSSFSLYSPHYLPSSPYTISSCSISSLYSHLPPSPYTPLTIFLLLLILPTSSSFSLYSLVIYLLLLILPHPLPSPSYSPSSSFFSSLYSLILFFLIFMPPAHLSFTPPSHALPPHLLSTHIHASLKSSFFSHLTSDLHSNLLSSLQSFIFLLFLILTRGAIYRKPCLFRETENLLYLLCRAGELNSLWYIFLLDKYTKYSNCNLILMLIIL